MRAHEMTDADSLRTTRDLFCDYAVRVVTKHVSCRTCASRFRRAVVAAIPVVVVVGFKRSQRIRYRGQRWCKPVVTTRSRALLQLLPLVLRLLPVMRLPLRLRLRLQALLKDAAVRVVAPLGSPDDAPKTRGGKQAAGTSSSAVPIGAIAGGAAGGVVPMAAIALDVYPWQP